MELIAIVIAFIIVAKASHSIGYIWGKSDQRIKDLEQFTKTGRLDYGWEPSATKTRQ